MADTIRVYPLVDAKYIATTANIIADAMFGMKSVAEAGRRLRVSAVSGCCYYADRERLWMNGTAGQPPATAADARRIAEQFLRDGRSRLATMLRKPSQRVLVQLIPDPLRHVSTKSVLNPKSVALDHWLSLFRLNLRTGREDTAEVPVDANLEVRVGAGDHVVGFSSNWRPFNASRDAQFIPPPPEEAGSTLIYAMGGSDEPQSHIAPYHVKLSDDDGSRWPASNYSLTAEIIQQPRGSSVELNAVVAPQRGRLSFAWGAWNIIDSDASLRPLGSGSRVELQHPGIYNVILDVREENTSAFTRIQRTVYVQMTGSAQTRQKPRV